MPMQLKSYPLVHPPSQSTEKAILEMIAYQTDMNWGKAPIKIRVNANAFPNGAPDKIGDLPVEVNCSVRPGWLELVEAEY